MNLAEARNRKISLRLSLSGAFLLTVLFTTLVLGVCTFLSVRTFVRNEIRDRLGTAVSLASIEIDPNLHAQLKTKEDENTPSYQSLQNKLRRIRDSSKDIRYVYTFRKLEDGNIVFVVDAEESTEKMSHIGDPYDTPTEELKAAFTTPYKLRIESEFSTDEWGTWLSAFAPILDSNGNLEAIVGMDIAAEKILEYEREYLLVIVGIALPLVSLVALLGSLFARRISKPILDIANELERIQHLEFKSNAVSPSMISEISEMTRAVSNMKRGLRSFSRYVPTDVVRDLMELQKEAEIGAEKRELTFFFSDLANFTKICEQWPPDVLAANLDAYFECITRTLVSKCGGTVDKFVGDAVMAFWGAPKPNDAHAKLACMAALSCQLELEKLIASWKTFGVESIQTRIGINTGSALVGNFGFNERLSYTAIGDNVNLASRLESLNKLYGTRILISEETWKLVHNDFEWRLIDSIIVHGRTHPCRIFEIQGEKGQLAPEKTKMLERFNEAVYLYLNRKWNESEQILAEMIATEPQDKATSILLGRCRKFQVEPPPADWIGTTLMREK